ncbi:MAG: nucleoside phosphorylase [Tannerellaceae bacterium]|jgi:uridine phosphorylase|nr:nucleoside phosphorylase [Tannerellaceae bacterium]
MRIIPPSELIINEDGSIFHLHLKPEQIADRIILTGDPDRVTVIAGHLDEIECDVRSREFHSVTGHYAGKRISIVSHGIGSDNIDIVLTELDALANIDFASRRPKEDFRQLTLLRIGTCGSLQPFAPIGTYVAAELSAGLDGVLYFYEGNETVRKQDFEAQLLQQLDWQIQGLRPYVVPADAGLLNQIADERIIRGITIAANGFYGPQGRHLRLAPTDPNLNYKIEKFEYQGKKIINYEMESSALAGLSLLMGHRALTVCCIIAGRVSNEMNTAYRGSLDGLISLALQKI